MRIPKVTDTRQKEYTTKLMRSVWWKRWLHVEAPYRWKVRRLQLGFVLDIGCGIGRQLAYLGGNGVGVDHNPHSIEVARARGLTVFTTEEFQQSPYNCPERFDSLLVSHVLEHMTLSEGIHLVRSYLPLLKSGGRVVLITPQERSFHADPAHIQLIGFAEFQELADTLGLKLERQFSFPFPRWFGHWFPYVEFVGIYRKPGACRPDLSAGTRIPP